MQLFHLLSIILLFSHSINCYKIYKNLITKVHDLTKIRSDNEYTPLDLNYIKQKLNNVEVQQYLDSDSISKIGDYSIESSAKSDNLSKIDMGIAQSKKIILKDTRWGWGDGRHPTTKLCLEYVYNNIKNGDVFIDYGCGSGILTILAIKLGAEKALAIDIDEVTLNAANHNFIINDVSNKIQLHHTSEIYYGNDIFPLADYLVANILPGALTRLVVPIWGLMKPGGVICLSGMRPKDLPAVREKFKPFVDLSFETTKTISDSKFGDWIRWTVKIKPLNKSEREAAIRSMTETSME